MCVGGGGGGGRGGGGGGGGDSLHTWPASTLLGEGGGGGRNQWMQAITLSSNVNKFTS